MSVKAGFTDCIMVVHHIPPPENLWALIALYVAFTFFVSTTPSFHFVSKNVLETELGEALNDKEIYLKSDRGTLLVNPGFFFPGTTTPIGGLFCSPLAGFSLLAYEVS